MTVSAPSAPRAIAVWWKEFDRWDVKSFAARVRSSFPIVRLGPYIREHSERVKPFDFPDTSFRILGVTNNGGVFHAYDCLGKEIKQPYQRVDAGDFAYNPYRVNVGSIGVVPSELGGNYISPAYVVFATDSTRLLPEYLLLILKSDWFNPMLRAATAGSVRQNLTFDLLTTLEIPLPLVAEQKAIVARWRKAQKPVGQALSDLDAASAELDNALHSMTNIRSLETPMLVLRWQDFWQWDVKSSRAAAFRLANPSFVPLSHYAEEATELVRPWLAPEKEWPVYGVNNKEGVFLSHLQKGADFNAPYKRIRKDWFFHNPTRSSVGSLGIVPEVPDDAITSPEYQIWRLRSGSEWTPEFVAALIRTTWFVRLIQVHRVGAVKQRLYVENLLSMPMPVVSSAIHDKAATQRQAALQKLADARQAAETAKAEVEALIIGTKSLKDIQHG
jgi:hypothetical protein